MRGYVTPSKQGGQGGWADPTGLSNLGFASSPSAGYATPTNHHNRTRGAAGGGPDGVPPKPPATPPLSADATTELRESAVNAVVAAVASGQLGGESDDPAAGEDLAVRVAVRARPLVAKERLERARECLSYPVDGKTVILGKNRSFQFDEVFDPTVEQSTIYTDLVAPLVESCFNGAQGGGSVIFLLTCTRFQTPKSQNWTRNV